MLRRFTKLLRFSKRWGTCLSLWDPATPLIMDSIMDGRKMNILAVATHNGLYLARRTTCTRLSVLRQRGPDGLRALVLLLFFPQDDAMPASSRCSRWRLERQDFLVA